MQIKTCVLGLILMALYIPALHAEEFDAAGTSAKICQTMRKFQQRYYCSHRTGAENYYFNWAAYIDADSVVRELKLFGNLYPPYNPVDSWYEEDIKLNADPEQRVTLLAKAIAKIWNWSNIHSAYVHEDYHDIDGMPNPYDAEGITKSNIVFTEEHFPDFNLAEITIENYDTILDELDTRLDQLSWLRVTRGAHHVNLRSRSGSASNEVRSVARNDAQSYWNATYTDIPSSTDWSNFVRESYNYYLYYGDDRFSYNVASCRSQIAVPLTYNVYNKGKAKCFIWIKQQTDGFSNVPSSLSSNENWQLLEGNISLSGEEFWYSDYLMSDSVPNFSEQDDLTKGWTLYNDSLNAVPDTVIFLIEPEFPEPEQTDFQDLSEGYQVDLFKDENIVYSANPACSYQETGEVVNGQIEVTLTSPEIDRKVVVFYVDSYDLENARLFNNKSTYGDVLNDTTVYTNQATKEFSIQALKTEKNQTVKTKCYIFVQKGKTSSDPFWTKMKVEECTYTIKPNHYDICCSGGTVYSVVDEIPILEKMKNKDVQVSFEQNQESYILVDYDSIGIDPKSIYKPDGFLDFYILYENNSAGSYSPRTGDSITVNPYIELKYPNKKTIVYTTDSDWFNLTDPSGVAQPVLILDEARKVILHYKDNNEDGEIDEISDLENPENSREISYD